MCYVVSSKSVGHGNGQSSGSTVCTATLMNSEEKPEFSTSLQPNVSWGAQRPLVKTHAWPGYQRTFLKTQHNGLDSAWLTWLEKEATAFYIYRDGRDVLCSFQLFVQKYDSIAECSIGSFLRQRNDGISRVRRWAQHVHAWHEVSSAYSVQFERLLNRPEAVIRELGDVLGVQPLWTEPLLPKPFTTIWESRWARLTQMQPESTAIINEESRSWTDIFSPDDRQFFHDEAGDLLIELGYESTSDWV